jgi:DNA-binding MarR family transcriptional regulator
MEDNRRNVRRIANAICEIDGAYYALSKNAGVKENLFWLLYSLDDGEFHSQKQICDDWLLPRATVNTLIKECEASGYVTLKSIPGRKRELQICLTEAGTAYTRKALKEVYEAEEDALRETLSQCSPSFISDLERFTASLKAAFGKITEGN